MGLFDFLKPRANAQAQTEPKPEPVTPAPACAYKDYRGIVEMATMISGGDEAVIADFTELAADEASFCAKHADWCEELLECVAPEDLHTRMLLIFAYWLTGYDTAYKYGAYIDWKEAPKEVTASLQQAADNLGESVDVRTLTFAENTDTYDALRMIDRHLQAQGYTLAILDTDSDCYHLYIIKKEELDRLRELGAGIGFSFATPTETSN